MNTPIVSPKRKTLQQFVADAIKKHGNLYDYSSVNYRDTHTLVDIICRVPGHGSFRQQPNSHLHGGGCPKCARERTRLGSLLDADTFIDRFVEAHGETYDYSQVHYINSSVKVTVICRKHGAFDVLPHSHANGHGCPKCANEFASDKFSMGTEEFVRRATIVHKGKYDYSQVLYKRNSNKVCIVCPIHGVFRQIAADHLDGRGCWSCRDSSGEMSVASALSIAGIQYEKEKKFSDLVHRGFLRMDFWLPDLNIAIEFHGWQHFRPVSYFGGEQGFQDTLIRDQIKRDWCVAHGVRLIEITPDTKDIPAFLQKELS